MLIHLLFTIDAILRRLLTSMFCYYSLNKLISTYLSDQERLKIVKAFIFGIDAHEAQVRNSGEPYFTHPVAVACILAKLKIDADTIVAALLHDVVEDTDYKIEDIKEGFGSKVAELVEGVTKLTKIRHKNRAEQQAENFRKMILSVTKDVRVIFIKLADRLHNMRTLASLNSEKRRRISQETLDVFAPIAHRLGINTMKEQLEISAFQHMYPYRYRILSKKVKKLEKNREKNFDQAKDALLDKLRGLVAKDNIKARKKTLYSIYNKMHKKGVSFDQIMDMYAYKVVISNHINCYIVLGKIHELYKPVPKRFKDYIATPKDNGYQSIHTIVMGPDNIPLEIQIKTTQMDYKAEYGIAAHWSYKAGEKTNQPMQRWLKTISDININSACSVEFFKNVKMDVFNYGVFVFTPLGEIIELPQNATCVDFAYYIHTDVGNKCVAAKVNRRFVPLHYSFQHGDSVEIITSLVADPSSLWLNFVETNKAQSAIKDFLKLEYNNINYIKGKQFVENKFKDLKIELQKIPSEVIHGALCNYQDIETIGKFYLAIGLDLIDPNNFINFITKYIGYVKHSSNDFSTLKIRIRYGDDPYIL